MFGQQRQRAKVAHTPAFQRVEHLRLQLFAFTSSNRCLGLATRNVKRIEQYVNGQNSQPPGFLTRGNHRDAAEPAGSMHGGIGIGGHADVAFQPHGAHARSQFARHRSLRTVEPLQPRKIEQQTTGTCIFHPRSKRMSHVEQRSV